MSSDAERAQALLRYANYRKVADALLVSRAAVSEWARGRSVTPYRVRQLEQLLRPDLQVQENEPPPWAEALADKTALKVIEALTSPEREETIQRVIARLEAPQPQHDEAPHGTNGGSGRAGAKRLEP